MNEQQLIGISGIIILGIVAQWLAWRVKLPSILILLIFGFLAGSGVGFLNPDELFGDLLFPFVSISVAVILFEGGLNLRFSEIHDVGRSVRNMVTIGLLFTWAGATGAAYYLLNFDISLALLFGAILVVTGPTVIMPILRSVRPTGQVNSILKWEGILNDPIGAILAVLVFEGMLAVGIQEATTQAITGFLITVVGAGSIGLLGAYCMVMLLKYRLIPEFLQNAISLTMVVIVFTGANLIQKESGLFAVTIMGIFLANQKSVVVHHIIEFKENLRVLLISILFIVLAARLQLSELELLTIDSLLFLVILLLIIRPAAVLLSTIGSGLKWSEKLFLSWMAPRGIVAAAVSSLFAIELINAGYSDAQRLVPLTFLVIIGTISIYGLSAMPLAKWLKIADPNPQGCLIIGAHPLARGIGTALQSQGIKVLLVDNNRANISAARMEELPTYYGNILSEYIMDELDLDGIGRLLALTSNHEINSLAALYFSKIFSSSEVYQLAFEGGEESKGDQVSFELRGNILFGSSVTYPYLMKQFDQGAEIKERKITEGYNLSKLKEEVDNGTVLPLFLIDDNEQLSVFTSYDEPVARPGHTIICIVNLVANSRVPEKSDISVD